MEKSYSKRRIYSDAKRLLKRVMYIYTLARLEDLEQNLAGTDCHYRFDIKNWDHQDNYDGSFKGKKKLPRPLTISRTAELPLLAIFHSVYKSIRKCSDLDSELTLSLLIGDDFKTKSLMSLMICCYESRKVWHKIGNERLFNNDWFEKDFVKLFTMITNDRQHTIFEKLSGVLTTYLKYIAWHAGNSAEYSKGMYNLNRSELYPIILSTFQKYDDMSIIYAIEQFEEKMNREKNQDDGNAEGSQPEKQDEQNIDDFVVGSPP